MNGLREIRTANERAMDLPQTQRENKYRVERDKLGAALLALLKLPRATGDTPDHTTARTLLAEIFGANYARQD